MKYYETLHNIIQQALPQLQSIDQKEFNLKPSVSKWSKKELMGHLIDSACNNHQRFLRAEQQGNLIFWGYDQDHWVVKNNYQNRDLEEVLATWLAVNQHLGYLIKGLSEELLNKETTEHNFHKICMNLLQEKEISTLSYLVWDYLFHIEYHLNQIIPVYQKINSPFQ